MTEHPQHPRHLNGSKWTATQPADRERHWVVVAFAERKGTVTLEAVLTKRQTELPWKTLRDRAVWLPGWSARSTPQTLVVGAGLAGLTCARLLTAAGRSVTVVDKARGAGGRASTRRAGELRFDHGAQVITPRDPRFAAWIKDCEAAGQVARWTGLRVRIEGGRVVERIPDCERFVGAPSMSAPVKALAKEQGVRFGVRVDSLTQVELGWSARSTDGETLGPFEHVVVAVPGPQAVELLDPVATALADRARQIAVTPCWAVLVAFATPLAVDWDSAQVSGSPLEWAAHNSSKPGRPRGGPSCWVLHASPAWTEAHLERPSEWVAEHLMAEFAELVGGSLPEPVHLTAHRWRYASTGQPLGEPFLHDAELGLSLCGDGCLGPRLENAYLSGLALGEHLVSRAKAGSA